MFRMQRAGVSPARGDAGSSKRAGETPARRMTASQQSTTERLLSLWGHLGIERAHVATQMPGDVAELAQRHSARIAGLTLCVPTRLDPAPFGSLGARLLMIAGAGGLSSEVTARAASRLGGSRRIVLEGYDAPGWADVVADRTDTVGTALADFLAAVDAGEHAATRLTRASENGLHDGITWRLSGRGPALMLLPFFLAPSQWEPAIARLAERFTVIVLGGAHLGGVAALEDRARAPTYQAMFRTLIDLMDPPEDAPILDVGCGSGALDRLLARRLGGVGRIVASDLNPFLLREAAALATAEGLAEAMSFVEANAESLPFPDNRFGAAFSVTVLEECDADRALRELVRVVRPGGRVGVIVRSIDLRQHWNLDLPPALIERAVTSPQSVGAKGVADASLYGRMRRAGLADLVCFPSLVTLDRPQGPIWRYREDHVLAQLDPEETAAWRAARAKAETAGTLFTSHAMHCAVGTAPAAV